MLHVIGKAKRVICFLVRKVLLNSLSLVINHFQLKSYTTAALFTQQGTLLQSILWVKVQIPTTPSTILQNLIDLFNQKFILKLSL